jgi:hypothetical protein
MFRLLSWKQVLFAAIDPGAGGGPTGVVPGAQPVAPGTPQPQGQGQQGQQGQGDGFRNTFFQGVPDEAWTQIEPHMSRVNQHVTQLQQRYAPFSSYTPEAVQGLARFAEAFESDPAGQWIVLARALQQQGKLDPDLDVDHLESLLKGEPQGQPQQQQQLTQGLNPEDPRDAIILQLQQQVKDMSGWKEQTETSSRQRVEDAALNKSITWMTQQLKAGGIDEALLTRQRMIAQFVGHGGNAQAAVQDALEYRNAIMGGIVPDPTEQKKATTLALTNGVPKVPAERRPSAGAKRRGMFGEVSASAEQYMAKANQS